MTGRNSRGLQFGAPPDESGGGERSPSSRRAEDEGRAPILRCHVEGWEVGGREGGRIGPSNSSGNASMVRVSLIQGISSFLVPGFCVPSARCLPPLVINSGLLCGRIFHAVCIFCSFTVSFCAALKCLRCSMRAFRSLGGR